MYTNKVFCKVSPLLCSMGPGLVRPACCCVGDIDLRWVFEKRL